MVLNLHGEVPSDDEKVSSLSSRGSRSFAEAAAAYTQCCRRFSSDVRLLAEHFYS